MFMDLQLRNKELIPPARVNSVTVHGEHSAQSKKEDLVMRQLGLS